MGCISLAPHSCFSSSIEKKFETKVLSAEHVSKNLSPILSHLLTGTPACLALTSSAIAGVTIRSRNTVVATNTAALFFVAAAIAIRADGSFHGCLWRVVVANTRTVDDEASWLNLFTLVGTSRCKRIKHGGNRMIVVISCRHDCNIFRALKHRIERKSETHWHFLANVLLSIRTQGLFTRGHKHVAENGIERRWRAVS